MPLDEKIRAGLLDDILAQIDAEYATYHQTPVFTCQDEELAYWSRRLPPNTPAERPETAFGSSTENGTAKLTSKKPGQ